MICHLLPHQDVFRRCAVWGYAIPFCVFFYAPAHELGHPHSLLALCISLLPTFPQWTSFSHHTETGYMLLGSTLGLSGDMRYIIYPTFMLWRAEYEASYYWTWHCSISQSTGSVGRGGKAGAREESKLEKMMEENCHHPQFLDGTLLPLGHCSWNLFWIY